MSDDSISDDSEAVRRFEFDNDPTADGGRDMLGRVGDALNRRSFMGNAAKAGVGAAVLGTAATGTAAAKHGDEPYSDSPYEDKNQFGYGALTDVQIVKFATILERLEATFYTEAVGDTPIDTDEGSNGAGPDARLSEMHVEDSKIAKQFNNPSIRYSTFVRFKQIRDHEQAHVKALEGILEAVGADPSFASGLEFQFPYENFGQFLDIAQALEDTGAGAYTGAAPAVDTEKYLAAAAQIHGVENRHASYLRTINNPLPAGSGATNPFPDAFQPRLSVTEVVNRAAPFIKGVDSVDQVTKLLGGYAKDTGGKQG